MPSDTLILTVNERLARYLRVQYAKAKRDAGEWVCEPPQIGSWNGWLHTLYTKLQDAALRGREPPLTLLSIAQSERLWESVLADSPYGERLLQLPATARAARQAWVLGRQWQLDPIELERNDLPDVMAFAAWSRAFEKHCAANNWLDPAELAAYLATYLATHLATTFHNEQLSVPAGIELIGFDDINPQQQALLDTLRESGCRVDAQAATAQQPRARRLACLDTQDEINTAAVWAGQCLEETANTRVAIVVPELAACRQKIARALEERLSPAQRFSQTHATPAFNISLGEPLSDIPLVFTALQALSLAVGSLGYDQAGALLRSPFIAGADKEVYTRALLDVKLRAQRRLQINLHWLTQMSAAAPGCEQLASHLSATDALSSQWPKQQAPEQWAQCFSQWLDTLGWPHGRQLDSIEYQAFDAWKNLLGTFGSLGMVSSGWSASQALAQLRRLAKNTLFQAQTPAAQVEVLGVLEAVGQSFDHVWVMGLHDEVWPAAPRPNPFLPVSWQREAGVPHSSAAREYEYAQRLTGRLLQLAPEVIFSWPQRKDDAQLRPSPLIMTASITPVADNEPVIKHPWRSLAERSFAERTREPIPESWLPVLQENTQVSGGTWLLADQAACPFRATAKHRWQATRLEQPGIGLNAADRGALVHQLMAVLWNKLQSNDALHALCDKQRQTLVNRCVKQATDNWCYKHPGVLTGQFRVLEERRLHDLAIEWLIVESTRGAFSVEPAESEQQLAIGGLLLRARPDRIDHLPDNSCMVVDYKTGEVKISEWFGERPDAPQLPLYALATQQHVDKQLSGVLYAQLRPGKSAYLGITREQGGSLDNVPGTTDVEQCKSAPEEYADFDTLLELWRKDLNALAENYRQGDCEVDPKTDKTCRYCHLHALCRINEHIIWQDDGSRDE